MSGPAKITSSGDSRHLSVCEEACEEVVPCADLVAHVLRRKYVLNDSNALKKKVKHESRSEPYSLATEARDGSNVVIEMKTSFFEHTKSEFIKYLAQNQDIQKIDNAVGAKAQSANSGDAFVEYSVDISFGYNSTTYAIKLTAYTTSCRIMIQPLVEKGTRLGGMSVPKFFADNFLLPWCHTAYEKRAYNEKELLEAIHNEIKRLDTLKLEAKKAAGSRQKLHSVSSSDIKCVAKGCKYPGINSSNKSAVGTCCKCGCFELYECSKTKHEDRVEIMKGNIHYYCSVCFMKNPSMAALE